MKNFTTVAIATTMIFGSFALANADMIKIKVAGWDAATGDLTTGAGSIISIDATNVEVPETLSVGDDITIDFDSESDGFTGINSITIDNDM